MWSEAETNRVAGCSIRQSIIYSVALWQDLWPSRGHPSGKGRRVHLHRKTRERRDHINRIIVAIVDRTAVSSTVDRMFPIKNVYSRRLMLLHNMSRLCIWFWYMCPLFLAIGRFKSLVSRCAMSEKDKHNLQVWDCCNHHYYIHIVGLRT